MARIPGSRTRNYDVEPATNVTGPRAVNPHSDWQLMIEGKRVEKKSSLRQLSDKIQVPAGTLYNWIRSKKGGPSRSAYTDELNRRLSLALDIPEQDLMDAFDKSHSLLAITNSASASQQSKSTKKRPKPRSGPSTPPVVCYPHSFLGRLADRTLIDDLISTNVSTDSAKLILYRIWADFASGSSDRRMIGDCEFSINKQVRLLETFCEWKGDNGQLVKMAVESGFLKIEKGAGGTELVCIGFYPINSAWSSSGSSFQKRGAYSRVMHRDLELAKKLTLSNPGLWGQDQAMFPEELSETQRRETIEFIFRIYYLLKKPISNSSTSVEDFTRKAATLLANKSKPRIDDTLIWLLSRRKIPGIPQDINLILDEWDDYERQSSAEIS